MNFYFKFLLFSLAPNFGYMVELPELSEKDLDHQYSKATELYYKGEYEESVKLLKTLVISFMMLQHAIIQCGRKCENTKIDEKINLNFADFPYLENMGNKVAYGECFKTCMEEHPYRQVSSKPLPSMETWNDLESRQPYNYLQFAYYKTKKFKKCCEAVTTFLQRNPYDESMMTNMKFYLTIPQVKDYFFRDLEAPKFHNSYRTAVEYYEAGKYKESIVEFEKTLVGYKDAENECDLFCQHLPTQLETFDRISKSSIIKEMKFLECMMLCEQKLSPIIQEWKVENFTSRCFQFLQFAYFQVGETANAVSCSTSSFLLNPEADLARQNIEFYRRLLRHRGFNEDEVAKLLVPRKDAIEIYNRKKTINKKLDYLKEVFNYNNDNEVVEEEDEQTEEDISEKINEQDDLIKIVAQTVSENLF